MTTARRTIIKEDEEHFYHCMSRCVRRAYLCGFDRLTGKNFDHRKQWALARIRFLTHIFTIDVYAYALMSNHFHLLIRRRLIELSAAEVAKRWLLLYPPRRRLDGEPEDPMASETELIVSNPDLVSKLRERLSSVSWFMKSINEYLARLSNKEDECRGRFWEGRFKCQRIDSEAAAITCAMYIDLNPIRAKIAATPEESLFTSVWERIGQRGENRGVSGAGSTRGEWLGPIESTAERRGLSSMSLDEYLQLLDWTGRELRRGKRGAIPGEIAPLLERIRVNEREWVNAAEQYGKWFYRVVGTVEQMGQAAVEIGVRWVKGLSAARRCFVGAVVV